MLQASVLGLKYHRVLAEKVDRDLTAPLKRDFDYSFVVSYGTFDDDDYEIVAKNSLLIDVSEGLDATFARYRSTSRNEINRTKRAPELSVRFGTEPFDELYGFHAECERERGWYPVPEEELRASIVCSCSWDGKLVAGMSCYRSDTHLRVGRIFSRRRSGEWEKVHQEHRWLFSGASRRVVYELCGYCIENGLRFLDLGGIDVDDPSKAGISKFKQGFGGEIVPVRLGRHSTPAFDEAAPKIREMGLDLT